MVAVAAIRFLCKATRRREGRVEEVIPTCRKPQRLPVVLSQDEIRRLLDAVEVLKHRVILTVCHAAGLRISEAVRLTPAAIDSQRMVIRVTEGKGRKDRYVMLSPMPPDILRNCWRTARPKEWLSPGDLPGQPIPTCAVEIACKEISIAFADAELRFSGALAALADPATFAAQLAALAEIERGGCAKPPFAGPEPVPGYLGRDTHRVAIANSRLVEPADGHVSFTWKDDRQDAKTKAMTLPAEEFIRRFLLHTVPDGFHPLRHIGCLANRHRTETLALCRDPLAAPAPPDDPPPSRRWQDRLRDLTGQAIDACPCEGGRMLPCGTLPRRPPDRPSMWCGSS